MPKTARFMYAGLAIVLALSAVAATAGVPARGGECPDDDLPNNAAAIAAQYPTGRYDGLSDEDRMILTRVKSFMAKNGLVLAQPPTSAPATARPPMPTFDDLIAAWVAQQQQQQPKLQQQQQQPRLPQQAQPGSRLFIPAPLSSRDVPRAPMQNAPRPTTPPPKQVLAEIPVQAITAKSPRNNATSPKAASMTPGARSRTSPQSQRSTPRMGVPSPLPSSPRPAVVQVQQKTMPNNRSRVGAAAQSAPKPKSNGTRVSSGVAPVTTPVPSQRETIRSRTNKAGLRPSSPTPAMKSSSSVSTRPVPPPATSNMTSPAPSQRERNSPPPSQRERKFTSVPTPSPTSDSGSNVTSEPTTAPLPPNSEEGANTTAADATPAPGSDDVTPEPTPEPSNSTADNVTAEEPSPSPLPDAPESSTAANVTETLPPADDAANPTPDANATDVESGPVVNITDRNINDVIDSNVTLPDDSSNSTASRSALKSVAGPESVSKPSSKTPSEMVADEVAALETNRTYVDRDALAQAAGSSTSDVPAVETDDGDAGSDRARDSAVMPDFDDDDDDEFDDDDY